MDTGKKQYDTYREAIRFTCHRIAKVCTTEKEFTNAMILLNVLPGTTEFVQAKRAWLRFHQAKKDKP